MKKFGVIFLLIFTVFMARAATTALPAAQAFQLKSVQADNGHIVTSWQLAPGYYLYQQRFKFALSNPDTVIAHIEFPEQFSEKPYPDGQKMRSFSGNFQIILSPVIPTTQKPPSQLHVSYQGCSEQGLCYPQQSQTLTIKLDQTNTVLSEQEKLVDRLASSNHYLTVLVFLGLGILLSLTPCVLPMLPTLSAIIVGQKSLSTKRSFLLSLCYVLSIAVTFAILGIIAGTLGSNLQTILQKPWIIVGFSLIFVAMALSLFGLYNLELPSGVRQWAAGLTRHQKHGSYLGAAVLGSLSVLIASPCITPPLAAAIIYLGNQGNIIISATALFAMGLGIGLPLLVIGTVGPKLLPKAGSWMNEIKYFFGVLLLAVAIWMLARVLSAQIIMLLWAALAVGTAIAMGAFSPVKQRREKLLKVLGILLFIYGTTLFIGALLGNTNPLQPLQKNSDLSHKQSRLPFTSVNSLSEFSTQLTKAQQQKQPVMLDFYADWCVTCHEIEAQVFTNPKVIKQLRYYRLLQVDVTHANAANQALQRALQVIAPPTLVFFNRQGQEVKSARLVGKVSSQVFLDNLKNVDH